MLYVQNHPWSICNPLPGRTPSLGDRDIAAARLVYTNNRARFSTGQKKLPSTCPKLLRQQLSCDAWQGSRGTHVSPRYRDCENGTDARLRDCSVCSCLREIIIARPSFTAHLFTVLFFLFFLADCLYLSFWWLLHNNCHLLIDWSVVSVSGIMHCAFVRRGVFVKWNNNCIIWKKNFCGW